MLDRSVAPKAYPTDKLKIQYPQLTSFGDIRGMLIPARDHEIVNVEFIFESGKSFEKTPGISFLTIKMLQEGTVSRSSEEIVSALEGLGSFLEASSGVDRTTLKLFSLKKHFAASFELVREILLEPTFPEKELEVLKSIRKTQIKQQLAKNNQFATLKFNEIYFGKDHPVGRMPEPEQMDTISREQITDYYHNSLLRKPSFILSGNFDDRELKQVQDVVTTIDRVPDEFTFEPEREVQWGSQELSREGSQQASLRIGGEGIPRKHEDFHRLSISNALLGGFFGSRLMQNIREEKGLTYGIYSTLVNTAKGHYWLVGSELAQDRIEMAHAEILNEINKLAENPPGPEEVDLLKNYLRGKLMMSLDSVFGKVSVYRKIFSEGLSFEYLDDYLKELNVISPETISVMIRRYFTGKDQITLIVR